MGATTTHRAPERVPDGTCTQVWAWVTNKCRKRMNQVEGYIYYQRSPKKEKRKKKERKEKKLLESERSWEFISSDEESFLPGT